MAALLRNYRKLIAALVGAVGVAVTQGFIAGDTAKLVAVGVAFLTAVGVYAAPNTPTPAAILPPSPAQTAAQTTPTPPVPPDPPAGTTPTGGP